MRTGTLLVPRAWTATGQRSFAVNGPATWNRLPPALWSPDLSESAFKRALKTHLFSTARRHWYVHDSGAGYKYSDLFAYLLRAPLQGDATWHVYGIIPEPLPIYSESCMTIAVTVFTDRYGYTLQTQMITNNTFLTGAAMTDEVNILIC